MQEAGGTPKGAPRAASARRPGGRVGEPRPAATSGSFLDVFDAFEVGTVFVSGDPNSTLTYEAFLRGVRDEGAQTEVLRAGTLMDWGGVRADA